MNRFYWIDPQQGATLTGSSDVLAKQGFVRLYDGDEKVRGNLRKRTNQLQKRSCSGYGRIARAAELIDPCCDWEITVFVDFHFYLISDWSYPDFFSIYI